MHYSSVLALAVPAWSLAVPNPPTEGQAKRTIACNAAGPHALSVKTTTHPSGQTVDWIKLESQGSIASPPTYPGGNKPTANLTALFGLDDPSWRGPAGTVPVFRSCGQPAPKSPLPTGDVAAKRSKRESDAHLYAASSSRRDNWGAFGTFNAWNVAVESPDFSLMQTAIINDQGVHETLETGIVKYPGFYGDTKQHIFTYFTTTNYASSGDNIGGWDLRQKGFIQTDTSVAPGSPLAGSSVDGGAQVEVELGYQLYQGNWWLNVGGNFVGYYPASLFSAGRDASTSLATKSTLIDFYGEVFDSASNPGLTSTDMGSGKFPSTGYKHAAYLRQLKYINVASGATTANYDGTGGDIVPTPDSYKLSTFWNAAKDPVGDVGSYCFLGGPGSK